MKLTKEEVRSRLKSVGLETNTALTGSITVTIDTTTFVNLVRLAKTRAPKS